MEQKTFEDFIMETLQDENLVDQDGNVLNDGSDDNHEESNNEPITETSDNHQEDDNVEDNNQEDDEDIQQNNDEDDDVDDDNQENNDEDDNNEDDIQEDNDNLDYSKANQAFAAMRTQLKQYKEIADYFDEQAKNLGYNDVNALINSINEANMKKEAENKGVDYEFYKKFQELEQKVAEQELQNKQNEERIKNEKLGVLVGNFVENHKLSKSQVNELGQSLNRDGITIDNLRELTPAAVNRLLNAYIPSESIIQNNLKKKEQLKKESHVQTNANKSTSTLDDDIDKLARYFAKK
nr:MAG TPA: hypothetical protein [Caudoviricetes sp.]